MNTFTHFSHVDPSTTAIMIGEQQISYGRLTADIASLSAWLTAQDVTRGQRIGLLLKNPYWGWVARFAALRLGLIQTTLTQAYRGAELPPFDVGLGEFDDTVTDSIARRIITFTPQRLEPVAQQLPHRSCAAPDAERDGVICILTSGTTGTPKIVPLSTTMLMSRAAVLRNIQGVTANTSLLVMLASATMPGLGFTLATLMAGGCVYFVKRKEDVPHLPVNLLVTTPAELNHLLGLVPAPWDGRQERTVVVVGGRLPVAVRDEALMRACSRITIDYGASETNCSARGDASLIDRHPGAVGYPMPGATIEVVDGQGTILTPGSEGVVRVRTDCMVHGYGIGQNEKPSGIFSNGWFYPGDAGVVFDDRLLAITGRISEVINLSGVKIRLIDIDEALRAIPGPTEMCAIVLKTADADRLGILVVCDDTVDLSGLSRQITEHLPYRMRYELLRVDAIPRNDMGKIPRTALSAIYSEIFSRRTAAS